jgi:hypothetical protein
MLRIDARLPTAGARVGATLIEIVEDMLHQPTCILSDLFLP